MSDEEDTKYWEIQDILLCIDLIEMDNFRFMLQDHINLDSIMQYSEQTDYEKVLTYFENNKIPTEFIVTKITLDRELSEENHFGCVVEITPIAFWCV